MKYLTPESGDARSADSAYTTVVMMLVGEYDETSTPWLPAVFQRLVHVPNVVLDLTEARITDGGVVDELLRLHDVRASRGLARESIVMTGERADEPALRPLLDCFDVVPDLSAALETGGGIAALDYAIRTNGAPSAQRPLIVTLEESEWDIASAEKLAALLAPAAIHRDAIVDMSAVSYIDSTCLGKLVGMRAKRSAAGFEPARLVVTSPRVRRLFAIVKFDQIWPIFETLGEALHAGNGAQVISIASY